MSTMYVCDVTPDTGITPAEVQLLPAEQIPPDLLRWPEPGTEDADNSSGVLRDRADYCVDYGIATADPSAIDYGRFLIRRARECGASYVTNAYLDITEMGMPSFYARARRERMNSGAYDEQDSRRINTLTTHYEHYRREGASGQWRGICAEDVVLALRRKAQPTSGREGRKERPYNHDCYEITGSGKKVPLEVKFAKYDIANDQLDTSEVCRIVVTKLMSKVISEDSQLYNLLRQDDKDHASPILRTRRMSGFAALVEGLIRPVRSEVDKMLIANTRALLSNIINDFTSGFQKPFDEYHVNPGWENSLSRWKASLRS